MRPNDWMSSDCSSDLEERKPGRHHQIIGREVELEPRRLLDEIEILLDEIEDRKLSQIDLLRPRERKQQIKRPLPAVDIDRQRVVIHRRDGRTDFGRTEALRMRRERGQAAEPLSIRTIGSTRGEVSSRSEEHTSELQSLMRTSYAVFCL